MLDRLRRDRQETCKHEAVVVTRNHGIERRVCERCGRVSMQLLDRRANGEDLIGTAHHAR